MNRFHFPSLLLIIAISSASCGPTPTPPPGASQVTINSPQNGEIIQLGSLLHLNLQAASFTEVTRFEVTHCDSDSVYMSYPFDHIGEGGPYGSMYYTEPLVGGLTNEVGECTLKVRAKGEENQYSTWEEVTYIVEDLYKITNTIQATILSPTQGQVLPLDTPYSLTFQAVSTVVISQFEFEECDLPGELRHLSPSSV